MGSKCIKMKNSACLIFLILLVSSCSSPTEKAKPKVYKVEIKDMKFQPEELSVQKGDTVIFINHDLVVHDVTEKENGAWSSSPLASGKTWKLVVTQSWDYYCSIHQVMNGKLLVP